MSNSGDLELIYCRPHPETWQGLFSRHFISANLTSLPSSESYGSSHDYHRQHPPAPSRWSTRIPTRTLNNFYTATTDDDVAIDLIHRKPPHQTICIAVELTADFNTVTHNVLLSNIARLMLPKATCRWMSNYIRCRQSITSSRGVMSKARIVHAGVPQGSKFSPLLFSFYLADMSPPTEPVKRICYADDITVWALGVKHPELEHKVNIYLTEMSRFVQVNSLLIWAPKSSGTLFTPDPSQANNHPKIKLDDSELPLVRNQIY